MAFEPDYDSDMSYDDAAAALQSAVQGKDPGPAEQAPVAAQSETPSGEAQPQEQPPAPAEETPEEEQFFNPDNLAPELVPGWKQLQAAFTQKTQQLAQMRRELEQFGDLEQVSEAVDLYGRLSDPDNWLQLHGEITNALVEMGYDIGTAQEMAAEGVQNEMAQPQPTAFEDPDLAPINTQLGQLQRQLAEQQAAIQQFQEQQHYEQQVMEAQRAQQEYIAHMQQQVSGLRQAFPHYTDEDVRSVVELGSFYNDDLAQAAARYEEIVAGRLERYLAGKSGAQSPTHAAPAAPLSEAVEAEAEDIRELEDEMVEHFRRLQSEGTLDFS